MGGLEGVLVDDWMTGALGELEGVGGDGMIDMGLQQRVADRGRGFGLASSSVGQRQRGGSVGVVGGDHCGHCCHLRAHRLPLAAEHPPPVAK